MGYYHSNYELLLEIRWDTITATLSYYYSYDGLLCSYDGLILELLWVTFRATMGYDSSYGGLLLQLQ